MQFVIVVSIRNPTTNWPSHPSPLHSSLHHCLPSEETANIQPPCERTSVMMNPGKSACSLWHRRSLSRFHNHYFLSPSLRLCLLLLLCLSSLPFLTFISVSLLHLHPFVLIPPFHLWLAMKNVCQSFFEFFQRKGSVPHEQNMVLRKWGEKH